MKWAAALLTIFVMTGSAGAEELDLGAMVQPVPLDSKFSDPNYYVWCGAPVKAVDGRYHLFYSRWPKTNPNKFAPAFSKNADTLKYIDTRRKTAPGDAIWQVEWSDQCANDWSRRRA